MNTSHKPSSVSKSNLSFKRGKFWSTVLGLCIGTVVLVGCGDDGSEKDKVVKESKPGIEVSATNTEKTIPAKVSPEEAKKQLQEKNTKVNKETLETCIYSDYPELVALILDAGLDPNIKFSDGDTALIKAIREEKLDIARILIDRGADINLMAGQDQVSPISAMFLEPTAYNEDTDVAILESLLEKGVNVNPVSERTPLNWAIDNLYARCAVLLINNGAQLTDNDLSLCIKNIQHFSDYEKQRQQEWYEVAQLTLDKGAEVTPEVLNGFLNDKQWSDYNTREYHLTLLKKMLEKNIDVNAVDEVTNSIPLITAIRSSDGWEELIKVLLDKGADPSEQNTEGLDAITVAKDEGYSNLIPLLQNTK